MNVTRIGDGKFQARVGDFFGPVKKSKGQALQGLDDQLGSFKPLDHFYVRCGDGTVLHLFQMPSHGWNYRIIPPTGYVGKGVGVFGTLAQTKEKAMKHATEQFGGVVHVG